MTRSGSQFTDLSYDLRRKLMVEYCRELKLFVKNANKITYE